MTIPRPVRRDLIRLWLRDGDQYDSKKRFAEVYQAKLAQKGIQTSVGAIRVILSRQNPSSTFLERITRMFMAYDGITFEQIADTLGCSLKQVQRAKRRMAVS